MSVWKHYHAHGLPSLVTTNIADRGRTFASGGAARMLLEVITEVRAETGLRLLAFVIMPDHVHLVLVLPEDQRLGRIMQLIKGRFSNRYHSASGGSGRLWQGRYHERTLRSQRDLVAAIEYVHRNPVKAGLVSDAFRFAWSSANTLWETDIGSFFEGD